MTPEREAEIRRLLEEGEGPPLYWHWRDLLDALDAERAAKDAEVNRRASAALLALLGSHRIVGECLAEYDKQVEKWGDDHDDEHDLGDLGAVAALLCYPVNREPAAAKWANAPATIPAPDWARRLLVNHDRREQLVIAAALCMREADRLERAEKRT